MIPLGLSAADQSRFEAGLLSDHEIRITARVLTLEHDVVGELTGHVLSGQVDIDTTQQVNRSAEITLLDPDNTLGIDNDTPESAGTMAARMLQVEYGVWSQELPRWVDVPVFTGPITATDRDGDVVTMRAHGKESLLLDGCSMNLTYRKGTQKTTAIRDMLTRGGETRLSIPTRADRLTANAVVHSREALWPRVQGLVRSLTGGWVLAYDGRGTAELVDATMNTVWTFRGGDGGSLLSEPTFTVDTTGIKNLVVVTGGVPEGAKRKIVAVAAAPAAHPLSAANLGRNGKPRHLREDIDDDSITLQQAAQTLANNKLWELLQASIDAQFESLVIPHLEPFDAIRVVGPHQTYTTQLQKFSIPLTSDGVMTVGNHWVRRRVNGYTPKRPRNPVAPKSKPKPKKTRGRRK